MAAGLGSTNDPKELVPGDVGAIVSTMWTLREYGDDLTGVGDSLTRLASADGWAGEAADAFRSRFGDEPPRWRDAGQALHDAASALDAYATALDGAQQDAATAISTWSEGQAATESARQAFNRQVAQVNAELKDAAANGVHMIAPNLTFVDPGESYRDSARSILATARSDVSKAGDQAAHGVERALDKAPKEPGFFSQLASGAGNVLGELWGGAQDVGTGLLNGLASYGNAVVHHPEDLLTAVGGLLAVDAGLAGELLGTGLDATVIGSAVGIPLNVASAGAIAIGAGAMGGAAVDLGRHAATDDRISPWESRADKPRASSSGATPTDRAKEHLTEKDLDGAVRELKGEVVATKSTGTPYDHVAKVQQTQRREQAAGPQRAVRSQTLNVRMVVSWWLVTAWKGWCDSAGRTHHDGTVVRPLQHDRGGRGQPLGRSTPRRHAADDRSACRAT